MDTRLPAFRDWVREALGTFFSLDGRLLGTLRLLLLKPGQLTEDYLAGKRARHMPPLRLYLVCSLVYFFVATVTTASSFMFVSFSVESAAASYVSVLPKMMFVIVPLFALVLKGLYRRQQPHYAAHLIFVLHLYAAWYLFFAVDTLMHPLVRAFNTGETLQWRYLPFVLGSAAINLWILVYLFRALRRVFGQGRWRTVAKQVLLLLGYMLLLGIGTGLYFLVRQGMIG